QELVASDRRARRSGAGHARFRGRAGRVLAFNMPDCRKRGFRESVCAHSIRASLTAVCLLQFGCDQPSNGMVEGAWCHSRRRVWPVFGLWGVATHEAESTRELLASFSKSAIPSVRLYFPVRYALA